MISDNLLVPEKLIGKIRHVKTGHKSKSKKLRISTPSWTANMIPFTSMVFIMVLCPTCISIPAIFSFWCIRGKMRCRNWNPKPIQEEWDQFLITITACICPRSYQLGMLQWHPVGSINCSVIEHCHPFCNNILQCSSHLRNTPDSDFLFMSIVFMCWSRYSRDRAFWDWFESIATAYAVRGTLCNTLSMPICTTKWPITPQTVLRYTCIGSWRHHSSTCLTLQMGSTSVAEKATQLSTALRAWKLYTISFIMYCWANPFPKEPFSRLYDKIWLYCCIGIQNCSIFIGAFQRRIRILYFICNVMQEVVSSNKLYNCSTLGTEYTRTFLLWSL